MLDSLFDSFVGDLVGVSDSIGSWLNAIKIEDLSKVLNGALLAANTVSAVTKYRDQGRRADEARGSIDATEQANIGSLREQQIQREGSYKEQLSERARQVMLERARLRAIAASSGVTGPSLDDADQAFQFGYGTDYGAVQTNIANTQRQTERSIEATQAQARSARNKIIEPSLFSTGLEIIGAGANYARNAVQDRRLIKQRTTYD